MAVPQVPSDWSQVVAKALPAVVLVVAEFPTFGSPGQGVVVLGFPDGPHADIRLSATVGIVSGLGRDLDSSLHREMVQFDAAVNPGNSGGPVLDRNGRVVAVATAGATSQQDMNYGVLGANAQDTVKRLLS